jgi:hypothetical protein
MVNNQPELPTNLDADAGITLQTKPRIWPILLFPLWFWPVVVAAIFFGITTFGAPSITPKNDQMLAAYHMWLSTSIVFLIPSMMCAGWLAWRVQRQRYVGYLAAGIAGMVVTFGIILFLSIAFALLNLSLRPLGMVAEMSPLVVLGLVCGLAGRFVMARLRILPSRWPKAGKS